MVPVYNEATNLEALLSELDKLSRDQIVSSHSADIPAESLPRMQDYRWEFLFVNDGSKDDSLDVLLNMQKRDDRVNVVNLSRNFGKENALLAGMDYSKGDAVVIMDADLQHPVSAIPEMVYWWDKGYDDVYGLRINRGKESWLRKRLSLTFYNLLQGTTRIEILRNVGDFRLLDRRAIDAIRALPESQRYTKGLYCWVGYRKHEIKYEQCDRLSGKSSFNLKGLLNLAIEGIACFTTAPLRIASVIGFITSFFAIVYLIFVLIKTLFFGESVQGFPTLLCVILFIGGIQLIALGIIGEYIGRIFNETKNRPLYVAESLNGVKL